ncbi:MAG: TonB family protein [Prevotella sp.]|nr:TonB family protein [Prevotella sp.]
MEQKKTRRADIEQRRTTGFLMGLIFVLAVCYVALEWNFEPAVDDIDPLDLSELMHETELVPMSNEETAMMVEEKQQTEKAEQLRVVDDEVELQETDETLDADGDDDETLLEEMQEQEDEKALASLDVDPSNPQNFHVVEDLPKFPGGAVEFMKWLTKNLRYPALARTRKTQGSVVAVFYIEKDGSVTGINVVKSLSPECDREALRVLRMMPPWEPGIQHDQPCRTKVSIPIVFKL